MSAVDVTFFCSPARISYERDGVMRHLDYRVITSLNIAGMSPLLVPMRWPITQRLVEGVGTNLTIQLERSQAERLHRFADMCFVGNRSGYSGLDLVQIIMDQNIPFHSGKVEAEHIRPADVTAGMPCAVVNQHLVRLGAFIGVNSGLAFTYGRRSIGPAIVPIDRLVRFCGGAGVMHILGLQR